MSSLKVILICACLVTLMGFAQPGRTQQAFSKNNIPNATQDGRPECPLVTKLKDTIRICSVLQPIGDSISFFDSGVELLCFGVYDTHYQLCKVDPKFEALVSEKYDVKGFCGRAKTAFEKYKFSSEDPLIKSWAPRLKSTLSNKGNCSNLCIFQEEINQKCRKIVGALEMLPEEVQKDGTVALPPAVHGLVKNVSSPTPKSVSPGVTNSAQRPSLEQAHPGIAEQESVNPRVTPVKSNSPAVETPGQGVVSLSQDVKENIKAPIGEEVEHPDEQPPLSPRVNEKVKAAELTEEPESLDGPDMDPQIGGPDPDDGLLPGDDAPAAGVPQQKGDKDAQEKMDSVLDNEETPVLMEARINNDEESNLVTYFILMTGGAALFYVAFHNKNKLLALALEGRRANRRGGRHSSAAYSKLHSNLEEAIAAGPTSPSATHVLY